MIAAGERPSIDVVESETIAGPAAKGAAAEPMARAGARA
jgi:chemotaxis protein MotA